MKSHKPEPQHRRSAKDPARTAGGVPKAGKPAAGKPRGGATKGAGAKGAARKAAPAKAGGGKPGAGRPGPGKSGSSRPGSAKPQSPKPQSANSKSTKPKTSKPAAPAPAPVEPVIIDLRIEKLVTGGDGLARDEQGACFVPRTAPGDLVRAAVIEARSGYRRAELREVLEPGPDRREAPCQHFAHCGGCDLQHMSDDAQRAAKMAIVVECFQRQGKLDVSGWMGPMICGDPFTWRTALRLHAHPTGCYGLHQRGTHEVVRMEECPVMAAPFTDIILPWLRFLPPVDQVVVRLDGRGGWLLSLFGVPARLKVLKKIVGALDPGAAPAPGLKGLLFNNRPVWGRDYLVHQVAGHSYRVGAGAFFQNNQHVAEAAVATVRGWLDEVVPAGTRRPHLLDLYGGVGLFTLALADRFERATLVELDPGACRDAENNIARDETTKGRATVCQGDLAEVLARPDLLDADIWRQAVCVVDPPRAGLGRDGVQALLARRPAHIFYMSCDPSTQARDAGVLVAAGYAPKALRVLDMFPQTAHIESLMWLADEGDAATRP
jgi:23S rRNA (uracil1939-C5)-methyltransferase